VVATPLYLKQKLTPQQAEIVSNFRIIKLDSSYMTRGKEWLKDVVVKTSIKSNSYNTTKRVSNFSQVMTGEAIQKMTNTDASNAMLMIPGLHLRGGFLTLGGMTSFTISAKDEPLLIVDGVMVAGGNNPVVADENVFEINSSPVLQELATIPVDIIDFIEVLKGPEAAYYGTRSSNGVIIVNTHRVSNFRNHIENYGTIQYNSKSYHLAPNFSAPDYNDLFIKSNVVKDTRSTVYWNGHLYTNLNGKASIQFFTSDRPNNYTINITGVTVTGEQINKKFAFNNY
jgi:TonB-dependent SusC/RagA subfamily outer membrane receptor